MTQILMWLNMNTVTLNATLQLLVIYRFSICLYNVKRCTQKYIENKNKNILNNFLIAAFRRTRTLLFQNLPSPTPAPAPTLESENAPVLHKSLLALEWEVDCKHIWREAVQTHQLRKEFPTLKDKSFMVLVPRFSSSVCIGTRWALMLFDLLLCSK